MSTTAQQGSTPSTDDEAQPDPTLASTEEWRGVAAENKDDVSDEMGIHLHDRSVRLLKDLIRPYHSLLWWLAAAVVLENFARLMVPWLVARGVDLGVPSLLGDNARPLVEVLVAMTVAITTQAATRIWFLRVSGRVGQEIMLEIRRRLFRHFEKLDVGFHDKYTSGRVISRMTNDTDAIQEMLATGFDGLISAALTLVGTTIFLFILDWRIALLALGCSPFLYLLQRWFRKQSSKVYRRVRETAALTIVHFVESMAGIKAVQAYRREPRNQQIFEDLSGRYREANRGMFRVMSIFMPGITFVGNVTTGLVILLGGWLVLHDQMTVGVLAGALLYLRQFFGPMQEISQFYNSFQSATSALEKLSGVLEEQPHVAAAEHPRSAGRAKGAVDFHHVSFAYVPETVVLPDLDLHIEAGETLALVGTTGAGKTTIAKLVARFYDPTSGRIELDGIDLRELDEDSLRHNVVMVTQENFMFDGTVADNIRFGFPAASDEEIQVAAEAVGAHEFISAMEAGYATDVGKRGGRLSAGQRQLIAFARAFLADPVVLILDEATSSLDVPSERLVQHALRTVLKDRTAIIIAHRLSTVEIADRVLVLEDGQVVESGAPRELIAGSGRYAELHQAWMASLA